MPRHFAGVTVPLTAFCLVALTSHSTARADESDVAQGIAAAIIRQASVKCLADREFTFEEATFKGTAKAVEPEKNVEVEVIDFLYIPGRVVVTYELTARFDYAGNVTIEKSAHSVKAAADVSARIELTANYRQESGGFVIDAKIDDFDDFAVQVHQLEPDNVPGGKKLVAEAAEKALADHTDVLIRDVNAWLKENTEF